jgi:cellulose synthase/poly-beta-1,6-N-acetylglucosamine synthase-like glycosyltransferase
VNKNPYISVIVIDYKKNNPYLLECLSAIQKQTFKDFEIILETDHPLKLNFPKLKIVDYQGKYIPPANKRDHGAKIARGEILTFIDDDAYPDKRWLEKIIPNFKDKSVVAIGGPGITPPDVSWREAASGWASASPVGAGIYTYRFLPTQKKYLDDYPSMNLSVRREEFLKVGGYDSDYWPGEDTKLCLDLTGKLNKKIIYEPKAMVYHHRRPLWFPHLKQNGSFGLHRGFFARILPATSFRLIYFLPSLMFLGLIFLVIARSVATWQSQSIVSPFYTLGFYSFAIYFLALFINAIWIYTKSKSPLQSFISIPVIFITHLWYGIRFIQGYLFTAKLKR